MNQIELNLQEASHGRGTITRTQLLTFLENLRFERILTFVHLPCLDFGSERVTGVTSSNKAGKAQESDGIGREECQDILLLLHKKGVRKIIELIVEDNQNLPHKDTVIAHLGTFDVEIFNWKKLDLCTETIYQAAPNAKTIFLYSSGNNAVLRSWSAADGLANFKKVCTHLRISPRVLWKLIFTITPPSLIK